MFALQSPKFSVTQHKPLAGFVASSPFLRVAHLRVSCGPAPCPPSRSPPDTRTLVRPGEPTAEPQQEALRGLGPDPVNIYLGVEPLLSSSVQAELNSWESPEVSRFCFSKGEEGCRDRVNRLLSKPLSQNIGSLFNKTG